MYSSCLDYNIWNTFSMSQRITFHRHSFVSHPFISPTFIRESTRPLEKTIRASCKIAPTFHLRDPHDARIGLYLPDRTLWHAVPTRKPRHHPPVRCALEFAIEPMRVRATRQTHALIGMRGAPRRTPIARVGVVRIVIPVGIITLDVGKVEQNLIVRTRVIAI